MAYLVKNNKKILNGTKLILKILRNEHGKLDVNTHKVSNIEKKFLVWTGKYKNIIDVPEHVPQNVVERARNKMRIKIANYMMGATALGCFIMVYFGKEAAKRGESVSQANLEWHKQYNEDNAKAQQ